jgi:hypothetical protein
LIWDVTRPKKLHLIDIWADISAEGEWCTTDASAGHNLVTVREIFLVPIKHGVVELHQGRSHNLLKLFPCGYFDWVYVDGDHSFLGVLGDLLAAEPAIKPGGLLAGHDYATPEQGPQLRHYYPDVAKAVETFCRLRGWEIVCLSKQGEYSGEDIAGRHVPSYILAKQ